MRYFLIKKPEALEIVKTPSLVLLGELLSETSNLEEIKEIAVEKIRIEKGQLSGKIKKLLDEIDSLRSRRKDLSEDAKQIQNLRLKDIK